MTSKPAIHRDPFAPGEDARRQRGRKLGSRAKLGKRFFEDVYAAWEEQGESVLARAAFHDPMGFASMVARLMPQKLEITTPTDGMSDERLAEMLELAERMAALRNNAATAPGPLIEHDATAVAALPHAHSATRADAHAFAHENGLHTAAAEAGGGGPLGSTAPGVVTSRHAMAAAAAETGDTPVAEHNTLDVPVGGSATPNSHNATEAGLPYPVGRPFPKPDHVVERENTRALDRRDDDIDPASLF